jgi:hypothetical protein
MAIKPKPRQEVEAAWREYFAQTGDAGMRETRNVAPVLYLTDPVRVPFRGHMYAIPPIPYTVGLEVIELQGELVRITEKMDVAAYRRILIRTVKLIRQHVKPYEPKLWHRVRWMLGWNPFRRASEMELGEFLAGFVMRRTMPHE